jgi:hypothetical protein
MKLIHAAQTGQRLEIKKANKAFGMPLFYPHRRVEN